MPEKKFGIDLKSYDDIFKTEEEREEDRLSKIRDIPISEIDDFPDHPFMVRDDEDMQNLIESIKERGVITVHVYDFASQCVHPCKLAGAFPSVA